MGPVRQNPIQRTVSLFICVCIALCTIVAHNTAQNRPDNFPSCPPDLRRDEPSSTNNIHIYKTRRLLSSQYLAALGLDALPASLVLRLAMMFWIFCHSRSSSFFSSFGPVRRVLRPSAIFTPYWNAALYNKPIADIIPFPEGCRVAWWCDG